MTTIGPVSLEFAILTFCINHKNLALLRDIPRLLDVDDADVDDLGLEDDVSLHPTAYRKSSKIGGSGSRFVSRSLLSKVPCRAPVSIFISYDCP